jgi:hypothetical protein
MLYVGGAIEDGIPQSYDNFTKFGVILSPLCKRYRCNMASVAHYIPDKSGRSTHLDVQAVFEHPLSARDGCWCWSGATAFCPAVIMAVAAPVAAVLIATFLVSAARRWANSVISVSCMSHTAVVAARLKAVGENTGGADYMLLWLVCCM